MIKTLRGTVILLAVIILLAGCSSDTKPTDPAEFAQKWLNAVVDHSSKTNCTISTKWLTDLGKGQLGNSCDAVYAELQKTLGIDESTEFKDCSLQNKENVGQPGWQRVVCTQDAYAEVLISGNKSNFVVERVYDRS